MALEQNRAPLVDHLEALRRKLAERPLGFDRLRARGGAGLEVDDRLGGTELIAVVVKQGDRAGQTQAPAFAIVEPIIGRQCHPSAAGQGDVRLGRLQLHYVSLGIDIGDRLGGDRERLALAVHADVTGTDHRVLIVSELTEHGGAEVKSIDARPHV